MDVTTKYYSIKKDLYSIFDKLSGIENDCFSINVEQINNLALNVKKNKEELKSLSLDEFKKLNLELEDITKKIKKCFDNIVEDKEKEIKKVSSEINKLTNQRKLALYKR